MLVKAQLSLLEIQLCYLIFCRQTKRCLQEWAKQFQRLHQVCLMPQMTTPSDSSWVCTKMKLTLTTCVQAFFATSIENQIRAVNSLKLWASTSSWCQTTLIWIWKLNTSCKFCILTDHSLNSKELLTSSQTIIQSQKCCLSTSELTTLQS